MRLQLCASALFITSFCRAALVSYDLVITQGIVKKDGQSKRSWLINGQSPGPAIVATKGDTLDIRVTNHGSENITIQYVFFAAV